MYLQLVVYLHLKGVEYLQVVELVLGYELRLGCEKQTLEDVGF